MVVRSVSLAGIVVASLLTVCVLGCERADPAGSAPHAQTDSTVGVLSEVLDQAPYVEAPELAERVSVGNLPPIAERLPRNPLLVEPVERVGTYGGTWRMGALSVRDTGLFVRTITYENLVSWDPEWTTVIPNVAQSVEVNEDSTTFTFNLREGMRWSDGEPFTSDDVRFYHACTLHPGLHPNGPPAWLTVGGDPWMLEVESETRFTIRFSAPYGLFLQRLATTAGQNLTGYPEHYLRNLLSEVTPDADQIAKALGFDNWQHRFNHSARPWFNPELPTLHAWLFNEAYGTPDLETLTTRRNPYYWKIDTEYHQLPYIDSVVFRLASSGDDLIDAAICGEIDMQIRHIDLPALRDRYADTPADYRFLTTTPSEMNEMVLQLNLCHPDVAKRELFNMIEFRIALSHAIGRLRIIEEVFPSASAPYQASPRPESRFYNERLATQYTEYAPDSANAALDRIGLTGRDAEGFRTLPDGTPLEIVIEVADVFNRNWPRAVELIVQDWAKVGVRARLLVENWEALDASRNHARHDALVWLGTGGLDVVLTPGMYFPGNAEAGYGMNWVWWHSPHERFVAEEPPEWARRQIALHDEITATADELQQDALMREIISIAAETFHTIGIALPGHGFGIVRDGFKNVPDVMPSAWTYPTPAPTLPCQYFFHHFTTESSP